MCCLLAAPAQAARLPEPLADPAAFRDPPTDARPKFRWWWGDIVGAVTQGEADPSQFPDEIEAIAKAGFGGFEISFLGSAWATATQRQALQTAIDEARRQGLALDMTTGTAWPLQTPNTAPGTGLSEQELMYGREDLNGPTRFSGPAPRPLDDENGERGGKVIAVTAARVLEPGPAAEPGTPPARSTILDPDSLVDLTARMAPDGTVTWDVPEGRWILFSFWQRDAAEGVVDHLSAASAAAATKYLDEHQIGGAAGALRDVGGSFFEDSLELDVDQLFWTHTFQQEFRERRGYEMTRFLPLMFVQDMHHYWVPEKEPTPDFELPGGDGFRYRHDYYETLTDLYVDNHIDELSAWARTHGMRFRAQVAYGNSFEVVRSAREITRRGGLADDETLNAGDIHPFDITSRDWRFAFDHYRSTVSGAHQGGETQVGSELGAVFVHELMMGLDDYKRAMDKQWAAGVTRPLIHGMTHQGPGSTWPGRSTFDGLVADSWNHRTFPQWGMWKPLADYWARGALVLEQGTPRTDVAVYRDGFVTTAATIGGETPEMIDAQLADLPQGLRQPLKDAAAGTQPPRPSPFFDTAELERAGFTVGYLDPVGLRAREARGDGVLYPDGPGYRAVVIDERWMPAATADALDEASRAGLRVIFVGRLPRRANSARDAAAQDRQVRRAVARIMRRETSRHVAAQDEVLEALEDLEVRPAAEWSRGVRVYSQRREVGDTDYFYVWNAGRERVRLTGSFRTEGAPSRLDLWTGAIEPAAVYRAAGERVRVPLELGPGETTVLAFRRTRARRAHVTGTGAEEAVVRGDAVELRSTEGGTVSARFSDGSSREVQLPEPLAPTTVGGWSLKVDEVGPEGTTQHEIVAGALGDWRTIPPINRASGTGTYTATVSLPEGWTAADRGVRLDLGRIEGAVQVYVNDKPATPDVWPREPVDVTALLQPGENTLRVVLTTTLKNKAVSLLPIVLASRPALAAQPGTQPYGLHGPVRLIPYGRASVELPLVRACKSRRRFPIHVRAPRGFRPRKATLRVGKRTRRVRVRRVGRRLRAVVDLRGRGKGRARVRLTIRGAGGRKLTTTRRYRLCAKRAGEG